MSSALFSVLLAFAGYSILNFSQAVQKIALARMPTARVAGGALWVAALLASGGSFGIVFAAIALGNVAVVGAMAGTGLVSLALFSALVMGETLSRAKLVAIVAIVAGAAAVALAQGDEGTAYHPLLLWSIPAVTIAVSGLAWILTPAGTLKGVVIAAFSGFLGAYSQLFQKRSAASFSLDAGFREVLEAVATDPLTLVWIGFSAASMVVLQFAYRHGEAIRTIPAFTTAFIVTPVVGGVFVFGETLSAVQWVGVVVILLAGARVSA
ncbi:MAG: hypothetical protein PF508_06135 [Spirochaeta sp.]|jgi:drug/metabolite transporter (DMT)-like permease|nr:hypothetical protein [Spirochaeta sp.]